MASKGIILAGGAGTRMHPITQAVTKQLLPVYDKPMIYYPLTTLMSAGIRDVLIISQEENLRLYERLFGPHGHRLGINIRYAVQAEPKGIAEAFLIADHHQFIESGDRVCLILGDNLFHGGAIHTSLRRALDPAALGATIFLTLVAHPERYGVAYFRDNVISHLIEKPAPTDVGWSNWAVTGLYVYPSDVVEAAAGLCPSHRGELEITDLNKAYLADKELHHVRLSSDTAWLDTGSADSLLEASHYVQAIQKRQGVAVGSPELVAYFNSWITGRDIRQIAGTMSSEYGNYLREMLAAVQ